MLYLRVRSCACVCVFVILSTVIRVRHAALADLMHVWPLPCMQRWSGAHVCMWTMYRHVTLAMTELVLLQPLYGVGYVRSHTLRTGCPLTTEITGLCQIKWVFFLNMQQRWHVQISQILCKSMTYKMLLHEICSGIVWIFFSTHKPSPWFQGSEKQIIKNPKRYVIVPEIRVKYHKSSWKGLPATSEQQQHKFTC